MFCKYCGNPLSSDAKFCSKCGKIVDSIDSSSSSDYDFFGAETPVAELAPQRNTYDDYVKDTLGGSILKFAILSVVFACTFYLSFLGIIFSSIARSKVRQFEIMFGETEGRATVGKHINVGGTIGSWVMFILSVIVIIVLASGV